MTSSFPPTLTLVEVSALPLLSGDQVTYLWGLMQKTCFFFSRDKAKLVPMDRVAGRAGGTTIVIKSRARTTIKCHASYSFLVQDASNSFGNTHVEPNKIDEGGNEANRSNASHDGYIPESIFVELEA